MEFTGEQVVPEVSKQRLVDEDIGRYRFAQEYAKGLCVLDIASGTGLGTAMLADVAQSVSGVDISPESIAYAREHNQKANIDYTLGSADDQTLFPAETFDVIVSLETIEHLESAQRYAYLSNLSYWLKQGGTLILSTPNKKVTSPFREKPDNEFHVLEFTKDQLTKEVGEFFDIREVRGQRKIPKFVTINIVRRLVHLIARLTGRLRTLYTLSGGFEVTTYDEDKYEPRIFVLICKKK